MLIERITITKDYVEQTEATILFNRHIERYCLARKYLFGKVIDVACGVGYGSYLCAKNPDVVSVTGFDIDHDSVAHAKSNFTTDKTSFYHRPLTEIDEPFDCLLSLETIEHLPDPQELKNLADRCGIKELIISYPNKKTTHYNKWHLWDIDFNTIEAIFDNYHILDRFSFYDSDYVHLAAGKMERHFSAKKYLVKNDAS